MNTDTNTFIMETNVSPSVYFKNTNLLSDEEKALITRAAEPLHRFYIGFKKQDFQRGVKLAPKSYRYFSICKQCLNDLTNDHRCEQDQTDQDAEFVNLPTPTNTTDLETISDGTVEDETSSEASGDDTVEDETNSESENDSEDDEEETKFDNRLNELNENVRESIGTFRGHGFNKTLQLVKDVIITYLQFDIENEEFHVDIFYKVVQYFIEFPRPKKPSIIVIKRYNLDVIAQDIIDKYISDNSKLEDKYLFESFSLKNYTFSNNEPIYSDYNPEQRIKVIKIMLSLLSLKSLYQLVKLMIHIMTMILF